MPSKGSTAKRMRQAAKQRAANRTVRSTVRTQNKKFLDAVKAGEKAAAEKELAQFVKLLDTASGKGIYHRNTAARKKSRLQKLFNSMES